MVRLLPGDVVDAMFTGETGVTVSAKQSIRKALGLADPVPVQYVKFVGGVVTGSLGQSLTSGEPVSTIMARAVPITLELAVLAAAAATAAGIPLGVLSALRPNTSLDVAARVGGLIGLSVPNFWFATLALLATSVLLHWIPPVTWIPPWRDPLGNLAQMAIPALAIAVYLMATVMRMTRASMLEVLRQDYIRTARAKGLPERAVVFKHALKLGILPVVSYLGPATARIVMGSIVVETLFAVPGLGRHLVNGAFNRDYTLVLGVVLFYAAFLMTLNLIVDLAYTRLDPRVELT